MDSKQIIEREQQYGRTAGVLGIIGVFAVLLPALIGLASDFNSFPLDDYANRYEAFDTSRGAVLASQLLQGLGLLLFAAPLLFLFQAAMYRNSAVKRPLMWLTVIGPICFALAMILLYGAYASTVSTFIDGAPAGGDINQFAEDTLTESGPYRAFLSLQLAAALMLVISIIYTSLQAMRTGLLTRFMGTLGMAIGVGFIIFGPVGPLALGIFILTISLLIAGWWRGPRPPAWETGESMPWPKPGEAPQKPEEELADPGDFEGSGRALSGGDDDAGTGDDDADTDGDGDGIDTDFAEPTRPGRRDNRRKRKRKQRG